MKVLYGVDENYIDLTYLFQDRIEIPIGDEKRASLYSDPIVGVLKHIVVIDDEQKKLTIPHTTDYTNRLIDGKLLHSNASESIFSKLTKIHDNLDILFGNKLDEFPEQYMAVRYIRPHHCVLELGGNIGRNSCVIASILEDDKNLVVFESSPGHAKELETNRDHNGFTFHIEPSALSKIPLQQRHWVTKPIENNQLETGYEKVKTITYEEVIQKYNKKFNVLVADCEGALYYILRDMPEILKGIQIIILENDFLDKEQGDWVHQFLHDHSYSIDYEQSGGFGHYQHCFFQTYIKKYI